MKTRLTLVAMAFAAMAAALVAAEESADADASSADQPPGSEEAEAPAPASVADVLHATVARFPREPVALSGSLILRRQAGVIVREVPFTLFLDWGAEPAKAECVLLDSFGRTLNVMRVTRPADGAVETSYFDGAGVRLPTPGLAEPVAGTDISWLDISLSYLWWTDGRLLAPETFKGALCDIAEMRPPQPIPGCASVRLWIDRKRGFLRKAEQFDESGKCVRWMWVASVGKINDRWMIRNLEVKRPGTGLQTKLHVDDLEAP